MPDELSTTTAAESPVTEAAPAAPTVQTEGPITPAPEKTAETPAVTPEAEAPVTNFDPAKVFGRKSSGEPAKAAGDKSQASTADDEESKLPENAAPHIRKLAKAHDENKRENLRLKAELEAAKKQPQTAANQAEIAALKAQIEASKADKAEIERLRKEADESRKTLMRTNVRETPEYRQQHGSLSKSAKEVRGVLGELTRQFGSTATIEGLIEEMRAGGKRPMYNAVLAALRDAGDIDGEERMRDNLKSVIKSQDKLYELDQKAQQEQEAWKTNRKGEFQRTIGDTRKELSAMDPLHDKTSQKWMALPEEARTTLSNMEKIAEEAAEQALEMAGDPRKLAAAAYQSHLSLQIAHSSHQNALAQIEKVTGEFDTYRKTTDAELAALKSKLSGYERVAQGNPGGVARSNPTQTQQSETTSYDPARMFPSRRIG